MHLSSIKFKPSNKMFSNLCKDMLLIVPHWSPQVLITPKKNLFYFHNLTNFWNIVQLLVWQSKSAISNAIRQFRRETSFLESGARRTLNGATLCWNTSGRAITNDSNGCWRNLTSSTVRIQRNYHHFISLFDSVTINQLFLWFQNHRTSYP